jgi:hypothetical protein
MEILVNAEGYNGGRIVWIGGCFSMMKSWRDARKYIFEEFPQPLLAGCVVGRVVGRTNGRLIESGWRWNAG